jgi:hypothetical protein
MGKRRTEPTPEGRKWCAKCAKLLNKFSKGPSECRPCVAERRKELASGVPKLVLRGTDFEPAPKGYKVCVACTETHIDVCVSQMSEQQRRQNREIQTVYFIWIAKNTANRGTLN